ncbi:MAG: TolC family protein [Bryobacteraceae bacterium]|nr:TolC family protein [Bryobacteraceae bacterium]
MLTVTGGCTCTLTGQTPSDLERGGIDRYRPRTIPERSLEDSSRFERLVRAGALYLSLSDAIALAIENNLDVDYQRLTPLIAEADLLRARSGSIARGIPSGVREGPGGLGSGGGSITAAQGTLPQLEQSSGFTSNPSIPAAGVQTSATGPGVPLLDPAITGSLLYSRLNRPQTNTFITGTNALTTRSNQGALGLQKGFLFGGTASVGFDSNRQDVNNLRADVNPSNSSGISANFSQPLLRGFGRAVNDRYIRIAKNNRKVSDLVFEQQVISTAYAVARLYWDLVSLNGERRVQQQSLDLAERLLRENVQQEIAGTLAPIEVVRARAAVATSRRDVTVAETALRQQETILKDYLTRRTVDTGDLATLRIVPTESIPVPAQEPVAPLQDLVAEARRNRPDLAQADYQVANQKITLTGSRSGLLPELDLVLSGRSNALYGSLNTLPPTTTTGGTTGTPVTRTADPVFLRGPSAGFSQIFSGRFPDYTIGVQLNIPLLNRAAQADYARDQLALRQVEIRRQQAEKQVRVDIINAQIAAEQSRAAYDAAREAREFRSNRLRRSDRNMLLALPQTTS